MCVPVLIVMQGLTGCVKLSGNSWYAGPPDRPEEMVQYYDTGRSYSSYREEIQSTTDDYVLKHITIDSAAGPIVVDYFSTKERNPNLVFVFPVLGGKNFFEVHVAKFFAERGIDAAIVNRSNEFKDPKKFDQLEEIFRQNVVRDRIAMDYFEAEQGKTTFGSFGISRGGINVAVTAGVDPRLKYNVIVLGGTDLVDLFRDSNQPRIHSYIKSVSEQKGIAQAEFFNLLRKQLRTDPKHTAQYIDANNTLLILGIFDRTVPFSYGLKLRDQIGRPDTVFLVADHYVGLLYTQTISIVPPQKEGGLFPFPYVEQEAMTFFKRSFGLGNNWKIVPYRILQFPFNVLLEVAANIGTGIEWIFAKEKAAPVDPVHAVDDGEAHYWASALEQEVAVPTPTPPSTPTPTAIATPVSTPSSSAQ